MMDKYEKLYNEALDRMKHVVVVPKDEKALQALKETIFPELRESEDERIRKEIIEFIQWSEDRGMTRHDFHQAKRPAEWIAYLEKQKEQKLAEWSEEDEKMRNIAIEWAETMSGQFSFVDMDPTDFCKITTWLKSLRPSWKPSEEQMEAMEFVIKDYREDGCTATANYLQEILDQIKKL